MTARERVAADKARTREALRVHEDNILAGAELPGGEHLNEFARQIREHREAGNYTTQG